MSVETYGLQASRERHCDTLDTCHRAGMRHGEASTRLAGVNGVERFAGLPVQVACDPPALVVRCGDNDQRTGGRSRRLPEKVNSVLTEGDD